ncbi:probable serine hydrolase [Episyrphus balteatus]|uniref:probable serine hydrolase n=1 Tax=Episyrphus balteatus TaxID=286459 RepID=UPI0024864226|nr:probable serine hydrolase [Episyrphus balteatus]
MKMSTKIITPQAANMRKFEEIRIPVPWGHIAGRWYGTKSVRPILALHGWLDNYGTWDTLIPLLPPHIGILAIDMPGHGESSRLPDGIVYHGHDYLIDILRVMQLYNWNKVSIMAHSMCSMFAFVFAAYYPDRVDMLIQLDAIKPHYHSPEQTIILINGYMESFLLEEKRNRDKYSEPPSYAYEEVVRRIHVGSNKSVDKDKCKHLIRTNVTKSTLYPAKYYFSRDSRLKGFLSFFESMESLIVMAKRIKIPHLVIKASRSHLINEVDDRIIDVLQDNNPYFEFHIIEGSHHVHLNNASETSILVNTFINKWKKPQAAADNVDNYANNDDGLKPQPQICPMKPQGMNFMQKAKL